MKKILLAVVCFLLCGTVHVSANEPSRDICGIDLKLGKAEVEQRLKEIGTFERDERKRQQIWRVRHPSFSHIIISFDKEERLRFVTAVAREDGEAKRVRYADIGDLKQARQAGDTAVNNFKYEWELPAENDQPRTLVVARGRDPEFLTTYSLKKLD